MKILAAAIQMSSEPGAVARNRDRADVMLGQARDAGAELVVLPEMFNTGYGVGPRYGEIAEDGEGPTIRHLRERSRAWGLGIAAGFVEHHAGHLYDSLAFFLPDGSVNLYRKRHLVFWECSRFRKGREAIVVPTPWGRIGFAICADMIYRRVWEEYQGRIDLAVVSAAWPDFQNRITGRKHWLLGGLGPLCAEIPRMVAQNLDIPVIFANQCGETESVVPVLCRIVDRFAGRSSVCNAGMDLPVRAGTDEAVVLAPLNLTPERGGRACRSTFPLASGVGSSISVGR